MPQNNKTKRERGSKGEREQHESLFINFLFTNFYFLWEEKVQGSTGRKLN